MRVDDDALRVAELGRDNVRGLRATPGRRNSSSTVRGTSPPNSSSSTRIAPWIDFAFWRKKPVA